MPERVVVFYECQNIKNQPEFDRLLAVRGINALDDADWRVPHWKGDDLAVIVDKIGNKDSPSRLRFLRVRDDTPFVLSAARDLSPVEVEQDERITEFTHMVLFNDGFMGAITSRDAPSHKWLAYYLNETSGQCTHIVNLYRRDVVKRLKELREGGLTNVKVKIRTSELEQVEQDKDLSGFSAFWKAGKGTDAVTIGVEYGVGRYRAVLSDDLASEVQQLAEDRDVLEQMIVSGKDKAGNRDTINMKKERIAWRIDVGASAGDNVYYAAIIRARQELRRSMGTLAQASRGN